MKKYSYVKIEIPDGSKIKFGSSNEPYDRQKTIDPYGNDLFIPFIENYEGTLKDEFRTQSFDASNEKQDLYRYHYLMGKRINKFLKKQFEDFENLKKENEILKKRFEKKEKIITPIKPEMILPRNILKEMKSDDQIFDLKNKKEVIISTTLKIIESHGGDGVRYSVLVREVYDKVGKELNILNFSHIENYMWNIHKQFPNLIYKPERGLFIHTKYMKDDIRLNEKR